MSCEKARIVGKPEGSDGGGCKVVADSRVRILPRTLFLHRARASTFDPPLETPGWTRSRTCLESPNYTFRVCQSCSITGCEKANPGIALLIANEQRNAYGLRYNDYGRYRCVDSEFREGPVRAMPQEALLPPYASTTLISHDDLWARAGIQEAASDHP